MQSGRDGNVPQIENGLQDQMRLTSSGKLYNDPTPELIQARANAVILTNEYNASIGRDAACREKILLKLLKSVGPGTFFEPTFRCEFGFNIVTGRDFYANFDCVILDGATVEIGDSVLFGPRVGIYTSNHAIDAMERAAVGPSPSASATVFGSVEV
ncbi:acetyltransferase-like isoleucine patch superfamily enzyme [Rhodoblastus acidophilus]|uniref:maltose acetyltransferase domain-containing protein n=1 Tax=Rhodoblastus acidophilus TaxID=1074 RepID=UPI0022246F6E|nr:maltose acetyltransferase domain-containing protein [Rhodoblastus acidophilus]MCW2286510.1 acetyltransferase-like isoleucine patch superfamily enzyme [Rhodoblastus acidophilus]MCW2335359.1 acetyltransferase-like isoleucine patch superfamily enzyme [Rhodoblastus acidophilus]